MQTITTITITILIILVGQMPILVASGSNQQLQPTLFALQQQFDYQEIQQQVIILPSNLIFVPELPKKYSITYSELFVNAKKIKQINADPFQQIAHKMQKKGSGAKASMCSLEDLSLSLKNQNSKLLNENKTGDDFFDFQISTYFMLLAALILGGFFFISRTNISQIIDRIKNSHQNSNIMGGHGFTALGEGDQDLQHQHDNYIQHKDPIQSKQEAPPKQTNQVNVDLIKFDD